MNEDIIINEIIRIRNENKYSRTKVAELSNISLSSYTSKENRKSKFKINEIIDILKVFNTNLIINNKVINSNDELMQIIKKKREGMKITQEDMRQYLNLGSFPTYSNKENCKGFFTLEEVIKMCEKLQLNQGG